MRISFRWAKLTVPTLAACVFLASPAVQAASDDEETQKMVARLFEVIDIDAQFDQVVTPMVQQLLPIFLAANPNRQAGLTEILYEEISAGIKSHKASFISMTAAVYAKYFDAQDIGAIIAFYESPVGQKFLELQPQVMQESMRGGMQVGVAAAKEAMPKILQRVREAQMKVPDNL